MLWSLLIISLVGALSDATALCDMSSFTLSGTTSQSSTFSNEINVNSERAIDGDFTKCAHTRELSNSWWTIDLLGVYNVSSVEIFNKNHKYGNISGARIHIGNSRENNGTTNDVCYEIRGLTEDIFNSFQCGTSILGRYITVFSPETKPLVLCEVKICGTKQVSPFRLVKENKTWEDALSHCRNRNRDLASILDDETQAWAELEARQADTPFVWLALHYTCVLQVWFWVDNHRLEFNRWAPNNKTGDCDTSAAMETREEHLWFSMSNYEKFNFICAK